MAIYKNRKGLYILSADTPVTRDLVEEYIRDYDGAVNQYAENERMYIGNHDILRAQKPEYKPNNKLVVNFAKYIVDTLNGYFIGVPIKTSHPDEQINTFLQDFIRGNDLQDNEAEIAKMCSIYGRAFELVYTNEQSEPETSYLSPLEGFMVYDDTVEEIPLFFVRYYRDQDLKLHGAVYTRTMIINLENLEEQPHYFDGVPVVEYIENEERQGAFDSTKTLINALDKAVSEKANDVDYFADAYLKVIGAALDDEQLDSLRDRRIIHLPDAQDKSVEVAFLDKPDSDTTQEHLLDRLTDLIYQMSMIANVSDDTFSSAASGVALEYKLQPMKNIAAMKERKFQASLRRRWRLVLSLPTLKKYGADAWRDIDFKFTRNIPQNSQAEAETMGMLEGIVSKETQLSVASFVSDVGEEIKRLKKEQQETVEASVRYTESLAGDDDEQS